MLDQLRYANIERQKEWGGDDRCDLAFRALEVAGETGELSEAMKKFLRAQRGIEGSTATKEDVADEMADVIISIDLLANQMGIDLQQAVCSKFNRTSKKYNFKTKMNAALPVLR